MLNGNGRRGRSPGELAPDLPLPSRVQVVKERDVSDEPKAPLQADRANRDRYPPPYWSLRPLRGAELSKRDNTRRD